MLGHCPHQTVSVADPAGSHPFSACVIILSLDVLCRQVFRFKCDVVLSLFVVSVVFTLLPLQWDLVLPISQSASAGRATTSSQQVRTPIVLRCSSDGLELVSRLPSGPNAEHRQLQIDIKDSPVRGATGHIAH